MKEFHPRVIFLWILKCILSTTVGSVCDSGWSYHRLTGTCIRIFLTPLNTDNWVVINNECGIYKGGRYKYTKGHLVHIFNTETDNFVKDLLRRTRVNFALIGLNDRLTNGIYLWGNSELPVTYTGWKEKPHNPDRSKRSVVITRDGWEEYEDSRLPGVYFVCQVDAVFPQAEMMCPVAEKGKESPSIECIIKVPDQAIFTGLQFDRDGTYITNCSSQRCQQNNLYEASVNKTELGGTTTIWSSLKIKKVEIQHNTFWGCSVTFDNSHSPRSSCQLRVYAPPEEAWCVYTFSQSEIVVTCTTNKVYPSVSCWWRVTINNQHETTVHEHSEERRTLYYRTTCEIRYKPTLAGIYDFQVSMYPNIAGLEDPQRGAVRNRSLTVRVEPPKDPPIFLDWNGRPLSSTLNVTENQTIKLSCQVNGGNPPVYQTNISCGYLLEKSEPGPFVTMSITVNRHMHSVYCFCKADHIVPYSKVTSLQLRVTFSAKITSFTINKQNESVEIQSGHTMKMFCSAIGNPVPQIFVFDQNGKEIKGSSSRTWGQLNLATLATCNTTGRYTCRAWNIINIDEKNIDVRVLCPPEHCDTSTSNVSFGVPVNTDVTVKLCVLAYPSPTSFLLFKGETEVKKDRYQRKFNYVKKEIGQGEIILTIYSFTQDDLGQYKLYSEYQSISVSFNSSLNFELLAQGPPSCPTEFEVEKIDTDSVTFSWKAGFNGGLPQTFEILRYDDRVVVSDSRSNHTIIGKVKEGNITFMRYEVLNLSENTLYMFGINVGNDKGTTMCPELQASVRTHASKSDGLFVVSITVPVVLILCLVILAVVAAIFVFRRRRRHSKKEELGNQSGDTGLTLMGQMQTSNNNDDRVREGNRMAATPTLPEKVTKAKIQLTKSKDKLEEDNTYTQVTAKKAKKGVQVKDKVNVYNNENTAVYSNISSLNVAAEDGVSHDTSLYANAASPKKKIKNTEKKAKNNEKKAEENNGRTVNEDGLVYVSVEINKTTTNPEIVSEKPPKHEEQPVEYVTLDYKTNARNL